MQKVNAEVIDPGPLTKKEAEILKYTCEGYMRKQIAAKLYRSIKTVSAHIEHIEQKLDAHSTAQVVCISVARGMVKITIQAVCLTAAISIGSNLDVEARMQRVRTARSTRTITNTQLVL